MRCILTMQNYIIANMNDFSLVILEDKKMNQDYMHTDMNDLDQVKKSIISQKLKICVIGIGRIGLPTALSFARSGLKTVGVDINQTLVNKINDGIFPLNDEPGYQEIFDSVIKSRKFYATTKIDEAVPKSDVILLSLPTPIDNNNVPDYSALKSVGTKLGELIKPNSLIIVESTIEPGFIENELINIIIKSSNHKLILGKNVNIGVCPENANPGEILHDFMNLPRLIGAINEQTAKIITEIYQYVFPVEFIIMTDCKTANAVKLTTNVFRDINIAFVNELALLFEKLGIDTMEVLNAAKKKYNFQIHYPGAGVGGPCLPVNSYQLLNSARKHSSKLSTVSYGREVNEKMPYHVIDLLLDGFNEANKPLEQSQVLILGISYKPDVKDVQLSPAVPIIKKLKELKVNVRIYDPYFKSTEFLGIISENNLEDSLKEIDAIIIVTAHKEFFNINLSFLASKMKNRIIVDSRSVMDIHSAQKAGFIFRGLGRGKI